MLKNIMKRTVSTFLALTLVVSSVCFFDLSGLFPTADALITSTSYTAPDVTIVVPETFYMDAVPVWNNASTKTALNGVDFTGVKYYVNNTLSGSTVTPDAVGDAQSGKIYFKASSGTVTDLTYSIIGTNKQNVSISAGSSANTLSGVTLDTNMTAASTRTLEWVFRCRINGKPAEYHAFSVAYAPYYASVGTMINAENSTGNTSQMQGMAWISGVHSYTDGNLTRDDTSSDNSLETNHRPRDCYEGDWYRPLIPIVTPIDAAKSNNQSITDWFTQGNIAVDPTFSKYWAKKGYFRDDCYFATMSKSHIANLTVDISRDKNFKTIPNVTTGILVSDLSSSDTIGAYGAYVANFAGTVPGINFFRREEHSPEYLSPNGSFTVTANNDKAVMNSIPNKDVTSTSVRDYHYNDIPYNGVWDRATPTSTGTSMHYIHSAACGESDGDWIYLNMYLQINVTAVDKETLRSTVLEKQKQANALVIDNYSDVNAKLKTAYAALGDPTASQTTVNNAVNTLTSISAAPETKKTVAQHINARTGELMDANAYEVRETNLYDTVTVSANSYPGYTLTSMTRSDNASLFNLARWMNTSSGVAGGNQTIDYNAATDTLTMSVTTSDTHTRDYRSTNVSGSGYDYFPVDPNQTYALSFEYAGTGNGDIGLHCYDKDGKWLGVVWLHTKNYSGLMAATGNSGAFRRDTFYFCPKMHDGLSALTAANAAKTRYVSLCFGGFPNNDGDSSYGPAATSTNPLSCVFRDVTFTPVESLFDMDAWKDSDSGRAGNNQTLTSYDSDSDTLTLAVKANDTFTPALRNASYDIRSDYNYYYFAVNPYDTYTISYDFAGTGNGDIGVMCYDEDGHFLGNAWFHKNNYAGMMEATGSTTKFTPGSFEFCPATYTRPSGNTTYITPQNGVRTRYMALSFGGYPNSSASSSNPLSCIFRAVRVTCNTPRTNLFNSASWAASKSADLSAGGQTSGVSSISYDATSDTITVVNSGTDTYTPYENSGNILDTGFYYIPVDPDGTYTLDFDYASATRAEVGVICYNSSGVRIGNIWLFDSLKATGSTSTFRHHTEVISPQSNRYLISTGNSRFDVRYISLTFGNYAEGSQTAATCLFRNVNVTPNNELFDMAQWAFRSANRMKDGNASLDANDLAYDSETKTLTITSRDSDTISAYADSTASPSVNLKSSVTVNGTDYLFYYTPVQPGTTYTFEGEYAGTGNGDLGVIEYKADGTLKKKNWCHTDNAHDILDKTDSVDEFTHFSTSITTQSDTKYIALCFGGYPNSGATASNPVTCVFRDVKMHLSNSLTVPNEDAAYTFYYRPNLYYVSFDGNGSTSGSMNSQRFIYNEPQNLTPNAFSRVITVNYSTNSGDMAPTTAANTTATATFAGWAATAGGSVLYTDGGLVSNNLTSSDGVSVPLYAKWTDGSVTLPEPLRGGYTFDGWYTQGGVRVGGAGDSYTPDTNGVTLVAHWSPFTASITFDRNGVGPAGNMPPDLPITYNTASDPLPAPKSTWIDGWEFLGWTTDTSSGIGNDEGNISLDVRNPRRSNGTRDVGSSDVPTVNYHPGDVLSVDEINALFSTISNGETYTFYAVWRKTLTVKFVDYNNGSRREQPFYTVVYNGASSTFDTTSIVQGQHTGWTTAGWTTSRRKGAPGAALDSEIALNSDNNLFDFSAWANSASNAANNSSTQTISCDLDSETISSHGTSRDVMSKYDNYALGTSNFYSVQVDPYRTYTFGVDYAGTSSGQVGIHFYDASGNFISTAWLFQGTSATYGDPHRGGDHFGATGSVTTFAHEDISICPMTFENYNLNMTEAQRSSVRYIAFSFGNYSDGTVNASNPTDVRFRNVTFTEDLTYYGVYTQQVALTYNQNLTATVQNMPQNPAAKNRVANSALGFGDNDILNPSFTLSNNELSANGYTYQGWNTDASALTGVRGVAVTISENTTYYAIWTKNTFNIAFDKNGIGEDSNMPASITASYNADTSNLPAPTVTTVDGWVFQGWAVPGALTTAAYAAGSPIPAADTMTLYDDAGGEGETYTLYAVWKKTITATFIDYPNGLQRTYPISKDVFNGALASIAASEIPAQGNYSGWTSAGWTILTTKGATGSSVGALTLSQDITYYGVYTKQVALTYNKNTDDTVTGMPQDPAAQTCFANSALGFAFANTMNPTFTVSSAEPARTGYVFRGWTDRPTDTVANTSGTVELNNDLALYAVWELAEFNLTVETSVGGTVSGTYLADATNNASISVAANDSEQYTVKYSHMVFNLVPTQNTGYTFSGWTATGLTLTSAQQTLVPLLFNMPASDVTLKANFTANPYTITYYHGTGASGDPVQQNCVYNEDVTLYTNDYTQFTRTGYSFDGWNNASDGTGANSFGGGDVLTKPNFVSTSGGNYDLYAVWTQNDYSITYNLQGGTHGATHPNSATFDDPAFTVSAPTKDGYDFAGWKVTSGLDASTAKWGTSAADTTIANADTVCFNGASGAVYFRNLASADDAEVTLTATWSPKNYTIMYASNMGDGVVVNGGSNHAFNANVLMPDETVLNVVYAGYTFNGWVSDADGDTYAAGTNFKLEQQGIAYRATVTMSAQWTARQYRIVYNLNNSNYSTSDLVAAGTTGEWEWKASEDDILSKDPSYVDTVIVLHGAFADDANGEDDYFYLNKSNEVRFGLGWSYTAGTTSTDNMIPFGSDLTISTIPASVLTNATPVAGEDNLYEINLYMIWSANYYALERAVAQFQNTYMTFGAGASTLRGIEYGNSVLPVYTGEPTSAMLPAIASVDADYKAGGARAREIVPNTSDPTHGKYNWVAGEMDDITTSSWDGLDAEDDNDFISASLQVVNRRIRDILEQVIFDPCAQFDNDLILADTQANADVLSTSVARLNDAMDSTKIAAGTGYLLNALRLKDADLDYRLTDAEMTAINATYGAACETAADGGDSYRIDDTTAGYLTNVFGETLENTYPECETDLNGRHHSFNSLMEAGNVLGKVNAIFATFGFDPTQTRNDSADYFTSGVVDANGYVINNSCPYTTQSVYRLFDLVYGQPSNNGTYCSMIQDSINVGGEALYYQVKDVLGSGASTLLKKPSQAKLNEIVTMIAYEYHNLELKDADYSEFITLFQNYFDATWGPSLRAQNYPSSNLLSSYQTFFTTESYNALNAFLRDYFYDGTLWPNGDGTRDANGNRTDFPYYKNVEQNMVNGKVDPSSANARTYHNAYISVNSVDLTGFNYASCTLCAELCDKIDELVPARADYSEVFRLIARNGRRESDSTTFMIDTRACETSTAINAALNAFYPSTATNVGDNYSTWYTYYADATAYATRAAWEDATYTVTVNDAGVEKPLFDTEWLYRYYTESTVEDLRTTLAGINWNLNKLQQPAVDGRTGTAYTANTICSDLLAKIDALTAKEFVFYFYYGLPDNNGLYVHIDDYPEDPSDPNSEMLPYLFGMTFVSRALTPDASLSSGKTFYGWYTKQNDMTHCVSSSGNIYVVNLPIDETLLETWVSAGKAEVTSTDGEVFKVNLYGGYVENVTLEIDMDGGSATYTPADENGGLKTAVSFTGTASPTFNYGWTLTFSGMAKQGYTFRAWDFHKGANNEESVMNGNVYTFGYYTGSTKTNDTLTALWDAITYTVTFHANAADSTGTMLPQTLTYDTQTTLTANAFQRTGYLFDGWTTNSNGTGTTYEDEASVLNLSDTQDANIDLYVKWKHADYDLTFDVLSNGGTWQGWAQATANQDTQTKRIRLYEDYGTAIQDGKTWPNDPIKSVTVANGVTIYAAFLGWYASAADDGSPSDPIAASDEVTSMGNQTLYARFDTVNVESVKNDIKLVLEDMDANHYTLSYMRRVEGAIASILEEKEPYEAITAADKSALEAALADPEYADQAADGDVTPPQMIVYENKAVLQDAKDNNEFTGDTSYMMDDSVGEIGYVFPGKCYYTYYCYTNSTTPAIMIDAHDLAGVSNRVSYPTTFSAFRASESGIMLGGWMQYQKDPSVNNTSGRKAEYDILERRISNPYSEFDYFGRDYSKGIYEETDDDSYEFYTHEQYVVLKPQFVEKGGKQYALYTFELRDDSYNNSQTGLPADSAILAGAGNFGDYATVGSDLSQTPYDVVTPVNTITIFVEYNNVMHNGRSDAGGQIAANGVGTYSSTGALEVYNNFHENGVEDRVYVNVDYLYRNSAGVTTTDFIGPEFMSGGKYTGYLANDPVFGQTDVGSFYYLMKPDDPATIKYFEEYDRYLAENPGELQQARAVAAEASMELAKEKIAEDLSDPAVREKMRNTAYQAAQVQNGDYVYWPYGDASTQWYSQFYAQANNKYETLIYVHVYDRCGNHYTNILQRDLQDTKEAVAAMLSRGRVVVNETGGSGVQNITITQLNTQNPVSVSGMTDGSAWNVVNNEFTITGLPKGNNNYRYTMTITDNAGSTHVEDFQASSDGSVVVTVNDENMGGSYAAAATAPLPVSQGDGVVNGCIAPEEIEEADLTTLSIEEVQPDVIAANTIEEAQLTQSSAEERPDLYTFTLNEIYTVNLFADSTRDYTLTLKSTVGGIVKAYVNGEFSPAKSGKVMIPSGSQVQIRISSRAGYELESLTMIYPDGRTVNLVGAYNAEINDDVTIKAIFVKTDALLKIRVVNGAVSGKPEMQVSPYSRVTAVPQAAPEGKVFAYWAQDGADDVPVSYDKFYTFIATSDVTLKAIYADAPVAQTVNVTMDAQSQTHITVVNGMHTLSYSGKITVPEDAQIVEFGMVLTNQSKDNCTAENFVIGGTVNGVSVVKVVGQSLTEEGQIKINVNNVKPGQTRTGRLYLTVKLADGTTQTFYSNTWSELQTPPAA